MKIIFFCPPVSVINGGIKHIFRMAEALCALGYEACVFEQNEQRPEWFISTAPLVGQGIFQPDAHQVYVLPEDQPHILESFKSFPQRKIIYSQNHFYGALGLGAASSYADYGITHILCSSQTIYEHTRLRHPSIKSYVIPCSVDPQLFRPVANKEKIITYMPRKRMVEATYIRDMFRFAFPQFHDWIWQELSGLGEAAVAQAMSKAKVFLSLSRLEGFGLTPLEAMASGCVVAGFTGIGGREYATSENGYWADEDDFPSCVEQLAQAVSCSMASSLEQTAYFQAAQKTLISYTPDKFKQAIQAVWQEVLDF